MGNLHEVGSCFGASAAQSGIELELRSVFLMRRLATETIRKNLMIQTCHPGSMASSLHSCLHLHSSKKETRAG